MVQAMRPPEIVVFDLGKVLVDFDYGIAARRIAARGIISPCAVQQFIDHSPLLFMVAWHARLREQRVPTFIFSNTNDLAIEHIRRNFPFFAGFDAYVLSYEHGAMKPDGKLYDVVEQVTKRAGEQIAYLDDRWENAQAGAARGWQIIHHQTPRTTLAAARRLGLPV